jgi:hypothetical protein
MNTRHLQLVKKAVINGVDDAAISISRPHPRSEGFRGDEDRYEQFHIGIRTRFRKSKTEEGRTN